MEFQANNIKVNVCVTSGAVLLSDYINLYTPVAAQRRETARVLGLQCAPAELDRKT